MTIKGYKTTPEDPLQMTSPKHFRGEFQRLLTLAAVVAYGVWYAAGLILFATNWFPQKLNDEVSGWGDCVFLSLAGLLSFLWIQRDHGWRCAIAGSLLILGGAGVAEMLGVRTGYPFGSYYYTDRLGWRLFGLMPWIIPVCWTIVMANAYAICSVMIARRHRVHSSDAQLLLVLLTAMTVTFVDFNLEPVAVNVRKYWIWLEGDQVYYGVPRLNFFGWFFVSLILVSLLSHLLNPRQWRLSTAWRCLALLSSIQFFFMLLNWQAGQYVPVLIGLNLTGALAIGLAAFGEKNDSDSLS